MARADLFWSAIAGLVTTNVTAFILAFRVLGQRQGVEKSFVAEYALLAGIVGLLIALLVRLRHVKWKLLRWLFWGGVAVSLAELAFAYWMGVAYAVYDDPFRLRHVWDGFLLLAEAFPVWTASQLILVLMLLACWFSRKKLGLR